MIKIKDYSFPEKDLSKVYKGCFLTTVILPVVVTSIALGSLFGGMALFRHFSNPDNTYIAPIETPVPAQEYGADSVEQRPADASSQANDSYACIDDAFSDGAVNYPGAVAKELFATKDAESALNAEDSNISYGTPAMDGDAARTRLHNVETLLDELEKVGDDAVSGTYSESNRRFALNIGRNFYEFLNVDRDDLKELTYDAAKEFSINDICETLD